MRTRPWLDLAMLFALSLATRLLTAWPMNQPGYTDAYYYAVGARQLYAGHGFQEPLIWNYLDPPESLPHPGYLYWMPLAAMLGWLGMAMFGNSFRALQAPSVLMSALLPLVAYGVAWDLTGRRRHAVLAGLLGVFPGFYAHVLVLPDSFAPFALAGSICLWVAGRGLCDGKYRWFGLAGLAAGFGHLARADGVLLLGVALLAAAVQILPSFRGSATGKAARSTWLGSMILVIVGYLVVMGPWFLRNWQVAGTPLTGAGTKTMFLTTYDDVFAFGRPLTLEHYLTWGWGSILRSKAQALWINLGRLWAENLLVVLLPFSAMGLWTLRRERMLWPVLLYLSLLFLTFTFIFTFPGTRGGLYHSGGSLLPFTFAAAGPGLEMAVRWAARRSPGWHARQAWLVFAAGLTGMAVLVTVFALWRAGVLSGEWNERSQSYAEIGAWLEGQGANQAVVMVGDAPGFSWHTGHPAIAIPNEPVETILAVADRYGARYLVLDGSRPRTTDALYTGRIAHHRIALRFSTDGEQQSRQLYEILERGPAPAAPSPLGRAGGQPAVPVVIARLASSWLGGTKADRHGLCFSQDEMVTLRHSSDIRVARRLGTATNWGAGKTTRGRFPGLLAGQLRSLAVAPCRPAMTRTRIALEPRTTLQRMQYMV